jgi:hypothetical protein
MYGVWLRYGWRIANCIGDGSHADRVECDMMDRMDE